ncbi:Phosphate transporter PHO1-2 [Hibiscus syriacus]|uniref:Phosphate transporter PHO1-2 n=1 Tax=Hibiscus syriacus TaxID=106335 RepID=A0A6A3D5P3_HIBSY|nr:phosphate transporter PHO1-like [Hibiscus syriacus]KAE8735977.1 Phosphate transporter PHO1-2 [Hibiscus syriacus]
MVKFSKELEAQLIPEWKGAFVNYWQLKKHVKKIKLSRNTKQPPSSHDHEIFGRSIFDPIRFIAMKVASCSSKNKTNEIIQVRSKSMDSDEDEVLYQTELVQLFSEEDEVRVFFERLDGELNKVNQFYKTKESEFLERGEILNKQLQIMLDLKQIVADRQQRRKLVAEALLQRSSSSFSSSRNSDSFSESAAELNDSSTEISQTDQVIAALQRNGVNFINSEGCKATMTKKGKPKMAMRIDIPATTPAQTISAVTSMIWEDLVNHPKKEGHGDFINKKKIQCAEKMIRSAFVELYRGLGLLKTYSSLNMVALTKILKKFDKVSKQQVSASYLKAVKRSHFISSDKVVRLMDEVESIFTKHFANNDRKKAMKFLRPQEQKNSHMVTFFVGLFTGSFVSLFSVYVILAHLSGIFSPSTETAYMETVYPVFSVFALLSLHLFLYGCNLFMWKATRINYNFIFEFSSSTALKYRDAFLICTTFMTSVVGAMVIHLILRAGGFSPSHVDTIPGILLLIFICLLVCPFNIFYRPTRYCFLRIIRNIICSPLYKVLMVDFFMADQLTSQIPLLRHLESTICYFIAGSFKTHEFATCKNGKMYRQLAYVISFLPYYWRAMQCARRWFDEYDLNHLANMGKYVSAMVAAGARLTYATQSNNLWFSVVLVTSAVATVYQLYWDFVKDWGLLDPNSRNPWLRDDLILKNKSIYYISIALNVVLRVAWVESIMRFRFHPFQTHLLDFFLASLEVIRRGHWNFYRLENEHLNNVGKFRAVKTVPLPIP